MYKLHPRPKNAVIIIDRDSNFNSIMARVRDEEGNTVFRTRIEGVMDVDDRVVVLRTASDHARFCANWCKKHGYNVTEIVNYS